MNFIHVSYNVKLNKNSIQIDRDWQVCFLFIFSYSYILALTEFQSSFLF